MAAGQPVFEIAQLFEVAGPSSIEYHSVETRDGSTHTGSYKDTVFCELSGGCAACTGVALGTIRDQMGPYNYDRIMRMIIGWWLVLV